MARPLLRCGLDGCARWEGLGQAEAGQGGVVVDQSGPTARPDEVIARGPAAGRMTTATTACTQVGTVWA